MKDLFKHQRSKPPSIVYCIHKIISPAGLLCFSSPPSAPFWYLVHTVWLLAVPSILFRASNVLPFGSTLASQRLASPTCNEQLQRPFSLTTMACVLSVTDAGWVCVIPLGGYLPRLRVGVGVNTATARQQFDAVDFAPR
ncbi:hypothetical protein B0H12DRAFT_733939 [Mycena haematopus]|nr:hypothetical protein B0H12DRAFT_733939 [Mycena haematopus]